MSDIVGKRVELVKWPYGGGLYEGLRGIIISESIRSIIVKWDGMEYPKSMMIEEVALA